ncbi:hypothetical protein PInf_005772 [Phytophthora infestans]|nr:hypothetical protein PInf_005772 [Phytophthora infestans]
MAVAKNLSYYDKSGVVGSTPSSASRSGWKSRNGEMLYKQRREAFSSSSTSSSLDSDEDRFQDGLKWEYTEQLESIRVEKVKVKSETKKSVFYFRGVTQVEGTIEEVTDFLVRVAPCQF